MHLLAASTILQSLFQNLLNVTLHTASACLPALTDALMTDAALWVVDSMMTLGATCTRSHRIHIVHDRLFGYKLLRNSVLVTNPLFIFHWFTFQNLHALLTEPLLALVTPNHSHLPIIWHLTNAAKCLLHFHFDTVFDWYSAGFTKWEAREIISF